jgi:hypothetical protein
MRTETVSKRLHSIVHDLTASASAREVPADVAAYAASATIAALRHAPERGLRRRAAAYFDAVVRKRVVRRHPGSAAAARVILGSVVQDLIESGRSGRDVWTEIERGWAGGCPQDVLEEYRRRLCA